MRKRRRRYDPQVLADLGGNGKFRHAGGAENKLCSERDRLLSDRQFGNALRRRREIALFIKFPVIGEMRLGNGAEDPPAADGGSTVIELPPMAQRHSDKDKRTKATARLPDPFQRFQRRRGKPLRGE